MQNKQPSRAKVYSLSILRALCDRNDSLEKTALSDENTRGLGNRLQRFGFSAALTYGITDRLTFGIVYHIKRVCQQRQHACARGEP